MKKLFLLGLILLGVAQVSASDGSIPGYPQRPIPINKNGIQSVKVQYANGTCVCHDFAGHNYCDC